MVNEVVYTMVNEPDVTDRDRLPHEVASRAEEHATIELPWVPLPGEGNVFLTQVVVADRAHAVMDAVRLYSECRAAPNFNASKHCRLTSLFWYILQAAYPYHPWQWWEWERVRLQFQQAAARFLKETGAARDAVVASSTRRD